MMPFTAAKLGAVQGSAIVIVGERWGAESCPVVLAFRQERWGGSFMCFIVLSLDGGV
jgi:hypothetical protein